MRVLEREGRGGMFFTRGGVARGGKRALPFMASSFVHGALFGVVCKQAQLRLSEAVLMSMLVASGSAQFAVMEIWAAPVAIGAVAMVTLLVNLRYVLIASALPAWFGGLQPWQRYGSAFFLSDESWAISMREFAVGSRDVGVLVGSGAAVYAGWTAGTGLGFAFAPAGLGALPGLDFMVPALLVAVLCGFWRGSRASLAPWAVAAGVALVVARLLPGSWYVIAGGTAGALVGAWVDDA